MLLLVLSLAAWLHVSGSGTSRRRMQAVLDASTEPGTGSRRWSLTRPKPLFRRPPDNGSVPLVVLVQQLAALLRGGRTPSRLWEEIWQVHQLRPEVGGGHRISGNSLKILGAAKAASVVGNSAAQAIRSRAAGVYPRQGNAERRIWMELAACLEVAETSGCPLADLLTRFAAQLEAEEDAEAARQTALAGPKATVRLLSWLPVFGLVLGTALGVDPVGILLENIFGIATLGTGLLLTVAGRVWSSRLVTAAAGPT